MRAAHLEWDSACLMGATRGLTGTLADQATTDAHRAADRAAVVIRELSSSAEQHALARLFIDVWSATEPTQPVSSDLLRAFSYSGNYVAGAFDADERLVGGSVGFLGQRDGRLFLHSHITGVSPDAQNRSVGGALKLHQRAWALAHGIDEITWTFDPLVRRNAHFNLSKLGARIVAYERHFYGTMLDGINRGDESDRALASWSVLHALPAGTQDACSGAADILRADDHGQPVVTATRAVRLKAWVPDDIVTLRRRDPDLALRWRRALRESVGAALDEGYVAVAMSRDGWYCLTKP